MVPYLRWLWDYLTYRQPLAAQGMCLGGGISTEQRRVPFPPHDEVSHRKMQLENQGGAAYSWDTSFGFRRDLSRIGANQTELEFVRRLLPPPANESSEEDSVDQEEDIASDDDEYESESDDSEISEDDDIEMFLRGDGRLSTSSIQIKRFCKGATSAGFEGIVARGGKIWKGSIDDITRGNKSIYRGVLNAGKFRDELAKPVRAQSYSTALYRVQVLIL
jgi:hypothetical protein